MTLRRLPARCLRRGGGVGGSRWAARQQAQQAQHAQQRSWMDDDNEEEVPRLPYIPPARVPGQPLRKPAGSRVVVTQQGPRLEIEIPPAGLTGAPQVPWQPVCWSGEAYGWCWLAAWHAVQLVGMA